MKITFVRCAPQLAAFGIFFLGASSSFAQTTFINEFHYDDSGVDEGERIEVAGPSGTSLNGWRIILYEGNDGTVLSTLNLSEPKQWIRHAQL